MSEILSVNTPSFDNIYDQWITLNCSCGDRIDFWGDIPHNFKCPGCNQEYSFDDVSKFFKQPTATLIFDYNSNS